MNQFLKPSSSPLLPRPAVFLDRDGVLVEDVGLLRREEDVRLLPEVPEALALLKAAGYDLVVVSNQAVVARGLLDEAEVKALQGHIEAQLRAVGAPLLDGFYFCPHHPKADLKAYRRDCDCRKPRPGLILRAAMERRLDLSRSYLVGDRPTDLLAGQRAGCKTVWVHTGQHDAPLIQTSESSLEQPCADHTCGSLLEAARWILAQSSSSTEVSALEAKR